MTLEFRSIVRHGVLFFAYNVDSDVTNKMEYIAVELVDGRLLFHFDAGAGRVRVMTNRVYSTGEWIKVFKAFSSGFILVSKLSNSKAGITAKQRINFSIT